MRLRKTNREIVSMRIYILPILLAALSGAAIADVEVGIAVLPEWSENHDIEEFSEDRTGEIQFGIAYLLSDRQVRKTDDGFDYVQRLAYRVVDRSGLENAARITGLFDPSNEELFFNFVRVIRDGEVDDRLADSEITLLRQETGLESSLIDGSMTALIQLEDVRVGDVIDYSVSGSVESKLWPDDYFEVVNVEWSVPLAQLYYDLQTPEDVTVDFRGISTDIEPVVTNENAWTSYKLHVFDPDPIRFEESVPDDWTPAGFIVFTTMTSWADVVAWANPLYVFDEPLPKDFTVKLDEIASTYPRAEDRALHALRLVQEDVRYLGIEIALGSHVPRPPNLTLERGYGDCKDKSVLLVSALDYLGVDAVPALASLAIGDVLPQLPASIDMFDHVIVEFEIDGQKSWVDPTLSHQGGLAENLANLEYGYVLPIRAGQTDLVKLDEPLPHRPTLEILETFEIPESGEIGMKLTAQYTYRGASANSARYRVISLGQEDWARDFLDYYAAIYHGLSESKPFSARDDLDANEVVLQVEYTVGRDAFRNSDYRNELPVFATAVQGVLPRQVEANRFAPLRLPYGSNTRHTIRVAMHGHKFGLPENKSTTLGGISFDQSFDDDGGAFVLDFSLVISDEVADLASIKAVTDLADEIAIDTDLSILLGSATPILSKTLGLDIVLDPTTDGAVTRIDQQIAEKDYVEALTGLNMLIAKHSEPTKVRGFLQLKKAKVLVKLGRERAAFAPFNEAFELYLPPDADSYFKYMTALRKEDREGDIVPVMIQLFERFPEAVAKLRVDWVGRLSSDLMDSDMTAEANTMTLAIARAVHKSEIEDVEQYAWIFLSVVEELAMQENVEEASQYLPYLRRPELYAGLLTSKSTAAIWDEVEEMAGKDLSSAISDYVAYTNLAANLSPEDFGALKRHMTALRIAGKYQDATRFAELFIDNWARIEAVGEDAYWFVNQAAYALSDAGRKDEAIALMGRLVDLGVYENDELISMAINRATLMMHWGEFEAALAAVASIESTEKSHANDYGRMWIYATKACSLHQLGRTEEALSVLKNSILPIAEKNTAAHTETMLCLDKMDDAASILIDRLQDPDESKTLIISFSKFSESDAMPTFLAEMHRRADLVRQRKDVQEAFEIIGRSLSISGAAAYWGIF
jgi:transglutaminase-like putative cysteine protease/tetratricopeptide (TPR) repeat protein